MDKVTDRQRDVFPAIIPFEFPGIPGVGCAFTTGLYGNISLDTDLAGEAEVARRKSLAELAGFDVWTEMRQVHGEEMLFDPEPTAFDAPSELEADASTTYRPGHALVVKTADCQPLLLAHTGGRCVAALHVGWRGNSLNLPESGLIRFCRAFEIEPHEVVAVRGPSLGPRAAEFVNFDKEWPEHFTPWYDRETKLMDLWALTRYQLISAGMKPGNIFSIDLCTHDMSEMLFSYRRGHVGRQASVIFVKK